MATPHSAAEQLVAEALPLPVGIIINVLAQQGIDDHSCCPLKSLKPEVLLGTGFESGWAVVLAFVFLPGFS